MLIYDASLEDDPELVGAVAAAAAISLDDARLRAESEDRLAELRASRERSSPPATPNAGGWSATSTTAHSSGSSPWRSSCG
jgi:hypothetical protein